MVIIPLLVVFREFRCQVINQAPDVFLHEGILAVNEERVHRPVENKGIGAVPVHGDFVLDPHPMHNLVGVSNRGFFLTGVDFLNGHRLFLSFYHRPA